MLQDNYKPLIQLYLKANLKSGKPCIYVSKWFSDKEVFKLLVESANNNEPFNAIITIQDKVKFYSDLARLGIIKYDFEKDSYYWNEEGE